jgi:hypothetical protein
MSQEQQPRMHCSDSGPLKTAREQSPCHCAVSITTWNRSYKPDMPNTHDQVGKPCAIELTHLASNVCIASQGLIGPPWAILRCVSTISCGIGSMSIHAMALQQSDTLGVLVATQDKCKSSSGFHLVGVLQFLPNNSRICHSCVALLCSFHEDVQHIVSKKCET